MPRSADTFRLHFEVQYVGKTIKASKRRVTWKFAFAGDSEEHSVVLLHTLNSGKKVIFLNGDQIFEDDKVRSTRMCTHTTRYPYVSTVGYTCVAFGTAVAHHSARDWEGEQ